MVERRRVTDKVARALIQALKTRIAGKTIGREELSLRVLPLGQVVRIRLEIREGCRRRRDRMDRAIRVLLITASARAVVTSQTERQLLFRQTIVLQVILLHFFRHSRPRSDRMVMVMVISPPRVVRRLLIRRSLHFRSPHLSRHRVSKAPRLWFQISAVTIPFVLSARKPHLYPQPLQGLLILLSTSYLFYSFLPLTSI